jgi:hypothetical protein
VSTRHHGWREEQREERDDASGDLGSSSPHLSQSPLPCRAPRAWARPSLPPYARAPCVRHPQAARVAGSELLRWIERESLSTALGAGESSSTRVSPMSILPTSLFGAGAGRNRARGGGRNRSREEEMLLHVDPKYQPVHLSMPHG